MDTDQRLNLLIRFADVLLPGDDVFPSATASGMAALLLNRFSTEANSKLIGRLEAAVTAASETGGELSTAKLRSRIVAFEKSEPKLFDEIRKIVYITYYEQEAVVAAIRSLGTPYNTSPLPEGYPSEAFESGRDAPKHRRGHWITTDRVARLDLSSLDHLESGE
jgi:hypothetical protein